ncbi:putative clathrin assembly protein at4g25940 [Phtheirospermum japonicum]|uniref:Putative clathrin assembly protein at4g25940 n=1 Tax=Phtheirospermum japonicum TaxID=374723 RepID=A0A830CZC5_9LAMI|nr:putative clathrin assembly protein at4g25940 [Phtheirospermum japonicum]
MESFRKAYGALKDSTKVGLAKVNSEFKDLDIAIVKATNHAQCPPKERHVRRIFAAVVISRPRADVGYCIHALSKRLSKTRSWIVAIKTLIVFHRILREGDPSFREQLMHISRRGHIFEIYNFKDDTGPLAWDCSAWIRTYALYLEERLECFRNLNYDIESERGSKSSSKEQRKITPVPNEALLDRLPSLQQLLYRLVCCQPEGAARHNFLVQYALALVVKESFKVYCAINDGIINLVDMFFEMPKHDAVKALEIYKKAGRQADYLADFYEFCRTLDLAQTFQFPTLRQPPPSFLATMEDYIKEAPQAGSVSQRRQENQEKKEEPRKPEERALQENQKQAKEVESKDKKVVHPQEENVSKAKEANPPLIPADEPVDLLGLNEVNQKAGQLDETNALALAIVQPGNDAPPTHDAFADFGNTSGWELALVTAPSNVNKPQAADTKMAGGFNKSILDSLYEDDMARRQLQLHSAGYSTSYGYEATPQNVYDQRAPFTMQNNVVPPIDPHTAMMSHHQHQMTMQHHQMMMMQQQNMMMMVPHSSNNPYAAQYHQQQQQMLHMGSSNPFGDPFGGYQQGAMHPPHGNHTLL